MNFRNIGNTTINSPKIEQDDNEFTWHREHHNEWQHHLESIKHRQHHSELTGNTTANLLNKTWQT